MMIENKLSAMTVSMEKGTYLSLLSVSPTEPKGGSDPQVAKVQEALGCHMLNCFKYDSEPGETCCQWGTPSPKAPGGFDTFLSYRKARHG